MAALSTATPRPMPEPEMQPAPSGLEMASTVYCCYPAPHSTSAFRYGDPGKRRIT